MDNNQEQMELDTRAELERAVSKLTARTIEQVKWMIGECGETRHHIHTRHEAYGVMAQHQCKLHSRDKAIKRKMEAMLETLENNAADAILAADQVAIEIERMLKDCLMAAAEMKRVVRDLMTEGTAEEDG